MGDRILLDPRLVRGVSEFNQGLYFECHESLEEIWLEENGEEKLFYQGLIQIAAGYLKWEQGVLRGSVKLWLAGLEKLERYRPHYLGVDLESFLRGVKDNLREVEAVLEKGAGDPPDLKVPLLSIDVNPTNTSHETSNAPRFAMIRATDVQKSYLQGKRQIRALAGVSLEIAEGKFAVIMGPSGSGKSTLLHLLGGLDRPTEGEVLIGGRIISQMPDSELTLFRRRKIGFVFQFFNLLSTLTALENVILPLILDGRPDRSSRSKARALLERVGLDGREDHLPEELSGGEIQRVAIARALVLDPSILLADEPTGNLDSRTGGEILELIRRINREERCTVVMVTHDREAASSGDEFFSLRDGRIVEKTSP